MNDRFFSTPTSSSTPFDRGSPAKAKRALSLIKDAVTSGRGIVSYQVVQEFLNVALKRFEKPLTTSEAEQYLATVFRPLLSVYASQSLFLEALRLSGRYRLSWYDSLIVAAAVEGQCATLYSEDLQHGQRMGRIEIQNPFA